MPVPTSPLLLSQRQCRFAFYTILLLWNNHLAGAFLIQRSRRTTFSLAPLHSQQSIDDTNISSMRVKEIKTELQELKIDFTDCFDKESLVFRLQDAREGKVKPKEEDATTPATTEESSSASSETSTTTTSVDEPAEDVIDTFDKETALNELRGMTVRDLREELGRRQISRSGLFEKEDLVQALLKGREQASKFSATGILQPGQVTDLTGDQLQQELQHPTPMLLDVYATWCGPCKMMVPILNEAAADLGDTVRVVKMDSDKYPELAGQLRVGGLPTLILLKNGQEVDRIEGALMKDQLLGWISSKL